MGGIAERWGFMLVMRRPKPLKCDLRILNGERAASDWG